MVLVVKLVSCTTQLIGLSFSFLPSYIHIEKPNLPRATFTHPLCSNHNIEEGQAAYQGKLLLSIVCQVL